jgi:hypothetical protein
MREKLTNAIRTVLNFEMKQKDSSEGEKETCERQEQYLGGKKQIHETGPRGKDALRTAGNHHQKHKMEILGESDERRKQRNQGHIAVCGQTRSHGRSVPNN